MLYLYKVKIHGKKRAVKEWFTEPLAVGHTYAGPISSKSHAIYDVVELLDIIEN